jgi:glycosyltransferase involved in cell wall biosynthesis
VRVAVNLLWLVPGVVGGSETVATGLLRQLAEDRPDDIELTLFGLVDFGRAHPDLAAAFPTRLVPLNGRMKSVRVLAENSWLARGTAEGFDLAHHMGGVVPTVGSLPGVVTIHDLQPFDLPANFSPAKRLYLQRSIPRTVRRARVVIAPSEFVRQGLVDRFGVPPERVVITPWGTEPPDSDVSVGEVQARYRLPRRWFVYPAFTWWHKDHATLLHAFAKLAAREQDVVLVLTGGAGPAEASVADQITRLGLRDRVRRTGLIPRKDVMAIMRGAVAVTYPSRYEGFGLPALEAMQLGTPLLAAGGTGLAELVADASLLVPAGDTDAWADAMAAMLKTMDAERQRLVEAGRERAAGYTWAASAAATLSAYRLAAAVGTGTGAPGEVEAGGEDKDDNGVAT